MMYRAVMMFRDLEDGHLYQQGEQYPHDGREVAPERIEALVTGQNKANMRLIEADGEMPQPEQKPRKWAGRPRKTEN